MNPGEIFRVRVKICGLTRAEDVRAVIAAGADAVGFVFTASPRRISRKMAIRLCDDVPEGILRVGLFLNQGHGEVAQIVDSVPLDVLQFHGSESRDACNVFGLPYLKAVAMQDARSMRIAERAYPDAMGLLLDSHVAGERGGSGKVFDWSLASRVGGPVWLAGGLNADNVGLAIRTVRPYAVDVSSSVEKAPGIKDMTLVSEFIEAARKA